MDADLDLKVPETNDKICTVSNLNLDPNSDKPGCSLYVIIMQEVAHKGQGKRQIFF